MAVDRFAKQASRIEARTVGRNDDTNLSLRDHCGFGDRDAKKIRVNGPQARRQSPQLNTLNTPLLYERNRILKIVVSVLSAIQSEDPSGGHRFTINGLDNAKFISADFDQRDLSDQTFKRILDEVQSGLKNICLNADFAFRGNDSARWHFCAEVAPLFNCDFAGAYVNQNLAQNNE